MTDAAIAIRAKRRERNARQLSLTSDDVWDFWERFPSAAPRHPPARGYQKMTFEDWAILDRKREHFRRKRLWARADAIRDRLAKHGIVCHDF